MYKVYNENNVIKQVSDEDIEKAIADNQVNYMIMQAMGQSHREEYIKYILPFLDGEYFYIRRAAIQAILNVNGRMGLEAMKKKSEQYSLDDEDSWNQVLLLVAIMMVEEGTEGLKKYFSSGEGDYRIKDTILTFHGRGYQFKQADIELICFYLESYFNNSYEWIKKLKKTEKKESMFFAFDSILYAGREANILTEISDDLSSTICNLCEKAIENRIDANYAIAITSQYMRKEYAIRILRALRGKVKGSARTEYEKSLKKWEISEDSL